MNTKFLQNQTEQSWNQWLAGLIDGDGCLLVSSKGYTSLEITMGLRDESTLFEIKQKLGGSIQLRSSSNAFRYRLHDRNGMLCLMEKINGLCRHPTRIIQLKKVCEKLNIPFKKIEQLTFYDGWFSGFFDADGTVCIRKGKYPQLTISVSQKEKEIVQLFQNRFGGNVRFDKSATVYKWDIINSQQIFDFCDFLKKNPLRSSKKRRVFLIPKYFELREAFAYRAADSTILLKAWKIFEQDWEFWKNG
jgi:hypothetical protein